MIKFFFYIVSLLIIILILTNSPNSNNMSSFINQNKFLNFSTNQVLIQKIITISITIFFILTIIFVTYFKI
uniref:Probable protein-export membrane protein SecG n=1 Tax=Acrosorium ciliolatum TaxID=1550622 RepID=A0A1Z1M295_9FLOR|nr:preprotein-translocase subunit g [Acrosorium ciliolatum]ARW60020.1 preprotein-translocase subunit g [Acrosorium ciliolatum]